MKNETTKNRKLAYRPSNWAERLREAEAQRWEALGKHSTARAVRKQARTAPDGSRAEAY